MRLDRNSFKLIMPSLRAERSNPEYLFYCIASGYRPRNDD